MEQAKLFHKGSGERARDAAVARFGSTVLVRINGLELKPKNRSANVSFKGRMAEANRTRKARQAACVHVAQALGIKLVPRQYKAGKTLVTILVGESLFEPTPRVVVYRLGAGNPDRGGIWEACKPIWDGVADALGLANDHDLQERGEVKMGKVAPKTYGVLIELEFG